MVKDSAAGYGWLTIALHWISALSIIFLFGLGVYMRSLGYYDEWYHKGPALHIGIGVILFGFMLVRLLWRWRNPTPLALSTQALQNLAAKFIKVALYLLIFAVMISGYLIATGEGKPVEVFELFAIPAISTLSPAAIDLAGEIHEYGAWIIIFLAALHAGAALMHHFYFKDRTLVRMLKPVSKANSINSN